MGFKIIIKGSNNEISLKGDGAVQHPLYLKLNSNKARIELKRIIYTWNKLNISIEVFESLINGCQELTKDHRIQIIDWLKNVSVGVYGRYKVDRIDGKIDPANTQYFILKLNGNIAEQTALLHYRAAWCKANKISPYESQFIKDLADQLFELGWDKVADAEFMEGVESSVEVWKNPDGQLYELTF